MINCQDTSTAKNQSLGQILGLVKSAASKGLVPVFLIDSVAERLRSKVVAQFRAGANPSQLRSIVDANLPAALAGAQRAAPLGTGSAAEAVAGAFGSGLGSGTGPTLGPAGSGDFFDPDRGQATGGATGSLAVIPGRAGMAGDAGTISGVASEEVTPGEVRSYLSGAAPGDSDDFAIALWVGPGYNPYLMLTQLAHAKRLHNGVIRQCARYYKTKIYGDPDHPVRLGRILYGIVSDAVVRAELRGGPTSRHLLGQAVNFSLVGVDNSRVVEDIRLGRIDAEVGTYGEVNGIHASLPFTINGVRVERMRLWADHGVPGFVGYDLM